MKITQYHSQSPLFIDPNQVELIVKSVLSLESVQCNEVIVHFVTSCEIASIHDQLFGDPRPTDCISVPIDTDNILERRVLGEVFVSPSAALEYAHAHSLDPYKETTLYLIHALLHLIGYDDIGEKEARMREAEQRHLKHLEASYQLLGETTGAA